jgi:hypothetical protein
MEWLRVLYNNIVAKIVISLGGIVGITIIFIKLFGNKILEQQFEKGLERYRFKIHSQFDRISKIHQKEFETLPELWKHLLDAIGVLSHISNPVQRYPSLNKMSDPQLEEFLKVSMLMDSEKEELKQSRDKVSYYMKAIYFHKIDDAIKKVADFHNYLLYNKIFLTDELFNSFEKIDDFLSTALAKLEVAGEGDKFDYNMQMEVRKLIMGDVEKSKNELAKLIQQRLHFPEVV